MTNNGQTETVISYSLSVICHSYPQPQVNDPGSQITGL